MAIDYLNENNFVKITPEALRLGLSGGELIIYSIIKQFCDKGDDGAFTGSITYLSQWSNLSRQGVLNCLDNLILRNLISKSKHINIKSKVPRVQYKIVSYLPLPPKKIKLKKQPERKAYVNPTRHTANFTERQYSKNDLDRIFADKYNYDNIDI